MKFMACLLQETPINPYVQLVDAMTRFITPLWMGLALITVSYRCDTLLPSASNQSCLQPLNSPPWSPSGNPCMWQAPHCLLSASDLQGTAGITTPSAAGLVTISASTQ